jgi:hypothetical protein
MNSAKSMRRVSCFQDRVADVATPDGEALALALLKIAAADHRPARVAGENPPQRLDLIVELRDAQQACDGAEDGDLGLEPGASRRRCRHG